MDQFVLEERSGCACAGRSSSTNWSKKYGKHNRTFAVQMAWLFV